MADQQPTIGDLYKATTVTDDALNGAVDAILAGRMDAAYPIADGLVLDLSAAVKAHKGSRSTADVLADLDEKPAFKRTMARSAVILARPVKA